MPNTDVRSPAHIQADLEEAVDAFESAVIGWETSGKHMSKSDFGRRDLYKKLQNARRDLLLRFQPLSQ